MTLLALVLEFSLILVLAFALYRKDAELLDALGEADHFEALAQQLNTDLRQARTDRNALKTENAVLRGENAEFRAVLTPDVPKPAKKITARKPRKSVT